MSVNEHPCVNCGALDYHQQTTLNALLTIEDDGRVNPGRAFDVRVLACKKCGHVSLFANAFVTPDTLR